MLSICWDRPVDAWRAASSARVATRSTSPSCPATLSCTARASAVRASSESCCDGFGHDCGKGLAGAGRGLRGRLPNLDHGLDQRRAGLGLKPGGFFVGCGKGRAQIGKPLLCPADAALDARQQACETLLLTRQAGGALLKPGSDVGRRDAHPFDVGARCLDRGEQALGAAFGKAQRAAQFLAALALERGDGAAQMLGAGAEIFQRATACRLLVAKPVELAPDAVDGGGDGLGPHVAFRRKIDEALVDIGKLAFEASDQRGDGAVLLGDARGKSVERLAGGAETRAELERGFLSGDAQGPRRFDPPVARTASGLFVDAGADQAEGLARALEQGIDLGRGGGAGLADPHRSGRAGAFDLGEVRDQPLRRAADMVLGLARPATDGRQLRFERGRLRARLAACLAQFLAHRPAARFGPRQVFEQDADIGPGAFRRAIERGGMPGQRLASRRELAGDRAEPMPGLVAKPHQPLGMARQCGLLVVEALAQDAEQLFQAARFGTHQSVRSG